MRKVLCWRSALRAHRQELFNPLIEQYGGRIANTAGDSLLMEFPSVVEAVRCAMAMQAGMAERNKDVVSDKQLLLRIGINIGDVISEGDDLLGDGVNVTARLEGLADPGGICLSRSAREQMRDQLDLDLEDMGDVEVKNIARPVRVFRVLDENVTSSTSRATAIKAASGKWSVTTIVVIFTLLVVGGFWWLQPWQSVGIPATSDRLTSLSTQTPSIAVLPFENLSGAAEDTYIADGMTEALITSLTKVPELFVISRYSTATYKGKSVTIQQIADELGVRYVLKGGVQKTDDQLRVTSQLIDAGSGKSLWAEQYDRNFVDFFALQDDLVKQVLTEIRGKLTVGNLARRSSRKTNNLASWLLNIQAVSEGYKFTRDSMVRSRELNQAAHAADPNWARPLAGIAWSHEWAAKRGWSKSKAESVRIGMEFAQKAIDLDPSDPTGYQILGNLHFIEGNYDKALALKGKAFELAPNNFEAIVGLASLLNKVDQPQRAVELIVLAKRVSPILPWWVYGVEGTAMHLAGQLESAVLAFNEAIKRNPKKWVTPVQLAAVFIDLGQIDKAKKAIKLAQQIKPNLNIKRILTIASFRDPKIKKWYGRLLAKAGLPE